MVEHVFGGSWTEAKLARLRAYLNAYRSIFTENPGASWYTTWYVDAFAGTGTRTSGELGSGLMDVEEPGTDSEVSQYLEGSAKIALGLSKPFDKYLFIEKSKARVEALKAMIAIEYPELQSRCEIRQLDANAAIKSWSRERNWKKERAVVFLDPYGMQVDWATVKLLGDTNAVDLWYLFSLSGVIRMLTRDGVIEESWQKRLDNVFGTTDWRERFYTIHTETNLFGDQDVMRRDATVKNVQSYIEERLSTSFVAVAPSLALHNSRSFPLFALCFAASNQKGAKTALRIATHLLKED
jgi:three-Cys-motif partner protein